MPFHVELIGKESQEPFDDERDCSGCGYQLKGLPHGATCPECGLEEGAAQDAKRRQDKKPKPPRCRACGYLLVGLPTAGHCPECGAPYRPGSVTRMHATLVPDDVLRSVTWRFGLWLMASGTLVALFMQLAVLVTGINTREYSTTMALASLSWALGLWMAAPSTLDGGLSVLRHIRRLSIASQLLWPVAFMLVNLLDSGNSKVNVWLLNAGIAVALVLASIGLVGSLSLMAMLAKDLYMRGSAGRFQFSAFLFPLYSIAIWIAPYPAYVTEGIAATPLGGLHALIYVVVLGPWWAMFMAVLFSLFELIRRGQWEIRILHMAETRPERVEAKREAMNASIGIQTVGPTEEPPPVSGQHWNDSGDIPLAEPEKPDAD